MKVIQKGLALFLAFLLVLASFPLSSFAVTGQTGDSVTFNSTIEGGDDGVTNYKFLKPVIHITEVPAGYIAIYTAEDFFDIRNDLAQNYILMNNIDLSQYSCWAPIDQFEGILDGNGYEITNLYIDNYITNSSSAYAGLFGSTEGTIKNLGIGSGNIDIVVSDPVNLESNLSYIGTISGILDYDGKIINCYSYCDIETNIVSIEIGGIIGMLYYGQDSQLDSCYNIGKITSTTGGTLGGIVGLLYYSTNENNTITNCENFGSLNGSCTLGYGVDAGGIIGQSNTVIKLDTCVNYGQISSKDCVGGILGNGVETKVYYCENYGDISSLNSAGGIIGEVRKTARIEFSRNFGEIKADKNRGVYAGGIVGSQPYMHSLYIFDSANFGCVTASSNSYNSSSVGAYAGGIVGYADLDSNTPRLWIERCYNLSETVEATTTLVNDNDKNYTTNVYSAGIIAYGFAYLPIVRDCFNVAKISATGTISNSNDKIYAYAGGIFGQITNWSNGDKPKIITCYNVGIVHSNGSGADHTFGGSIGARMSVDANFNSCYYLDTTGSALNTGLTDGCTPLTQSQLSIKDNYNGFDFDNIWTMDGLESYRYPELINMPIPSENFGEVPPEYNSQALSFENKVAFIDIGENMTLNVHIKDVAIINGKIIYSNDQIVSNENLVWSVATGFENIIEVTKDGAIKGLSNGLAILSTRLKDDINLSTTCFVYVGKPNEFNFTSIYDTKQYYSNGGFYSEVSSVSDCVELYLLLENKLVEQLQSISGIDDAIKKDTKKTYFKDIAPITLTATVSGKDLSFSKDSYVNTYSATFNVLSAGKAFDDILMLFPYNLNISSSGNNYSVTVSLKSDSFDTVTEKFNFKIENLETKNANEHISFVSDNKDYQVSKNNIYGKTMSTLKNDAEYKWSKFSTFDFENYYEVVFTDILIQLTNTSQLGHISLLPVIKEWVSNYKTILSEVTTIVEDDYTGYLNVTENAIDKLLKKSKYETDGMDVNDELRDFVVLKLRDKVSIDKVNSAFAKIDKTQQYISYFKLSVNITNDIADFIDGVSVLNAYKEMDDEFKAVIQNLYNQIPSSEKKLKDAVYHYVNVDSYLGYSLEILNEVQDMAGDITLDVFNTLFKKQVVSSICKAIGNITLKSGALLSSTTAFSTISTGLGAVSTGATLGLCISDILCNSSGKSEEISKVVAMSEFSPYVIKTLNHYESKLYADRNDTAVTYYEYAFAMHKATQRYIMQHAVNSLEIKRDSLIIKLFGRDDYDGLINDILVQKRSIENLECHNTNPSSSVATETKVIAIKCPVNVFIYDENGKEVVRIENDIKKYATDSINVFVEDGKKYIALPTDQKYTIKIIATDSGTMEYTVTEYGTGATRLRTIKKDNIPLVKSREFTGQIVAPMNVVPESYALTYGNQTIVANNIVNIPVTGVKLDVNNLTMNIGETKKLFATVNPNNATNKDVTWSSDKPDVVKVDKDGNITALKTGVATITVSSVDWGYVDTCTIEIDHKHIGITHHNAVAATCKSTGNIEYWTCTSAKCSGKYYSDSACQNEITGSIITSKDSSNHDGETEYRNSKPATCYGEGYEGDIYCLGCNTKIGEGNSIQKLSHTPGDWKTDADYHWKECTVVACGVVIDGDKAKHNFEWKTDTAATEDATGVKHEECTICGYKRNENTPISKLDHKHTVVHHDAVPGSCKAEGNIEYWTCSSPKCAGKYFSEETCTVTVESITVSVDENNHIHTEIRGKKDATCTEDGYTGDTYCTDCGKKIKDGEAIKETGHTYENGKCKVCGTKDPNYKAPERDKETSPKTGDNSHMTLWIILASVSSLAVLALTFTKMKRTVR